MAKTPTVIRDEDARAQARTVEYHDYVSIDGQNLAGSEVAKVVGTDVENTNDIRDPDNPIASGADRIASFFMEYKIISKLLKSNKTAPGRLLTMGAVGVMQMMNVLPASAAPLLRCAGSVLGEDNVMGSVLNSIADKMPNTGDTSLLTDIIAGAPDAIAEATGKAVPEEETLVLPSGITEGSDYLEKHEGDGTIATAEDRVRAIYNLEFGEDMNSSGAGVHKLKDIQDTMAANARAMAEDGVFASCGNKEDTDREFAGMRSVMSAACASAEEAAGSRPKDVKDLYIKMAEGLAFYESGAAEGFDAKYADDPEGRALAEAGLSKVMFASRQPVIESIKSMQEQYGLFSEDEMARFAEILPGFEEDDLVAALARTYDENAELYMPDDDMLKELSARTADGAAAGAVAGVTVSVRRTGVPGYDTPGTEPEKQDGGISL